MHARAGNPLWKKFKAGGKCSHLSRCFDHFAELPECKQAVQVGGLWVALPAELTALTAAPRLCWCPWPQAKMTLGASCASRSMAPFWLMLHGSCCTAH